MKQKKDNVFTKTSKKSTILSKLQLRIVKSFTKVNSVTEMKYVYLIIIEKENKMRSFVVQ